MADDHVKVSLKDHFITAVVGLVTTAAGYFLSHGSAPVAVAIAVDDTGLSTVTLGGNKVEVSADGKKVTAYANGVETKASASGAAAARGVSISEDFNTVVLKGVTIEQAADGHLVISAPGGTVFIKPAPANNSLVQKVLEVGDRLKDGTVCIAVDLHKNKALYVPAGIFGGKAKFYDQDEVVKKVNAGNGTHGHKDWRRITDDEGKTLSQVWDKVAPEELKGRAAPWFWLASPHNDLIIYGDGHVRRGGEADWSLYRRDYSRPVPVVRTGPARS